jgi:hypothetical protein
VATLSLTIDSDLHVKVKKFAEGVGVDMSELVERALVFALSSRYPSNELPDGGLRPVDPGFGVGAPPRPDAGLPGQPGAPPRPDAGLPPTPGRPNNTLPSDGQIDNSLPGGGICPVFDPTVDNELPDAEVPEEVPEPK